MDLNLVRTFISVYQNKSYTRASESLGVSQPAVSMAIRRLEEQVGEPLFVKNGRSIAPTRRAVALAEKLQQGMEIIDNALSVPDEHIVYCIEALSHYFEEVSDISIKVPPLDQTTLFDQLRSQQVDLVIDTTTHKESAFEIELIHREPIKVICRSDHPRITGDTLSKEQFYQEGHIIYKATREGRQFLELFAKEPLLPRIERKDVSNQAAMALSVADTFHLGLVFGSFADKWASRLGLKVLSMPIDSEDVPIHMIYHRRAVKDPNHIALRDNIKHQIQSLLHKQ